MSCERHITFIMGREGFATWKLNRLKVLASYFRAVIIFHNISTGQSANTEHILQVMSIGSQQDDLCQLWIAGADAELACMVLTDFVVDQFEIINTSHKRNEKRCNIMLEKHRIFCLPFFINYYFESIHVTKSIEKRDLIEKISRSLNAKTASSVFDALLKREAICATGIGHGIALPHIMINDIKIPSVLVLRLDKAVNWDSPLGDVRLIIALLLPAPAPVKVVKACTQIPRALLDAHYCHLLTSTREPEFIKALLFHVMARAFVGIK